MRPTRRAFVATLLGGVAAILGRLAPPGLPIHPANPEAFLELGHVFLAAGGSRSRAEAFLRASTHHAHRRAIGVGRVVADRRPLDFQSGNTVIVGGWILAESEALFCAGLTIPGTPRG